MTDKRKAIREQIRETFSNLVDLYFKGEQFRERKTTFNTMVAFSPTTLEVSRTSNVDAKDSNPSFMHEFYQVLKNADLGENAVICHHCSDGGDPLEHGSLQISLFHDQDTLDKLKSAIEGILENKAEEILEIARAAAEALVSKHMPEPNAAILVARVIKCLPNHDRA
jgi:hypothetical protein